MDKAKGNKESGNRLRKVMRLDENGTTSDTRLVPEEVPVALIYNGVSHVVMMMTPTRLREFAVGFSLTEGLISSPEQLHDIDIQTTDKGILLKADLPKDRFELLSTRMRGLAGQTGCGICGLIDLENVAQPLPAIEVAPEFSFSAAKKALNDLSAWQVLNADSGALHAAAFADWKGTILNVCEDVGRHNALDKLIGTLALEGLSPGKGFVVLSSRCSYELVQKVLSFGIGALVTISAPTDFAVTIARDHKLTLVALAREDSMLCFNDPFGVFSD